MTQLNLFEWGDLCHCWWTIEEHSAACAVCRIAQTLDYEFVNNALLVPVEDDYEEIE